MKMKVDRMKAALFLVMAFLHGFGCANNNDDQSIKLPSSETLSFDFGSLTQGESKQNGLKLSILSNHATASLILGVTNLGVLLHTLIPAVPCMPHSARNPLYCQMAPGNGK